MKKPPAKPSNEMVLCVTIVSSTLIGYQRLRECRDEFILDVIMCLSIFFL